MFISEALNAAMDVFAPSCLFIPRRRFCPSMADEIRNMMQERNLVYKVKTRKGNLDMYNNYKISRNGFTRQLEGAIMLGLGVKSCYVSVP